MSETITEYDVLDQAGAEDKGWVVVHESVSQGHFRAEKMAPNGKIEQAGSTMEGLLLAISYYEGFQDSLESPPTPEQTHAQEVGDASRAAAEGEDVEGAETAPLSVTAPDGSRFTEEEWALRDSGYEPAEEAMVERQEINTAAENEAKQPDEDEIPESETLVTESRDNQPDDTLLVRPGEETMTDVIERKQEESELSESERGAVNQGIGPHGPIEGDAPEGPMGGEPETYDPGPGLSETEQAQADEHQQVIEDVIEARDEETPPATTEEEQEAIAAEQADAAERETAAAEDTDTGPVSPADSLLASHEPPPDTGETPAEAEEPSEAPPATPAAEAKAEELGVDLNEVEGTGADGKIVVGDVEAAASDE